MDAANGWPNCCRVYKQIRGFETWVRYNSPGSNIKVLTDIYQVAASCSHLAHAITPPYVYLKEAQYRVTLTGYGPQANPRTVQVHICYMLSLQIYLSLWQHASIHGSNHDVHKHQALHCKPLTKVLPAGRSAFQPTLL